jgi:hypothetical protein
MHSVALCRWDRPPVLITQLLISTEN